MITLKVADLINRLNEIGYDENTELVFGYVDGDTGSWYQVPFDRICYGEEVTGHPYCKDVINIDVDIDSVKEYAKSKVDSIVYNLVDDIRYTWSIKKLRCINLKEKFQEVDKIWKVKILLYPF